MDTERDIHSLPEGPKDLCFKTNDFMKTPFSVDTFLQNQRKNANLETMRDDLGIYLKVLRSAMIELINKDYADFVNLSSNLIDLDKAIIKIQVPLGQLKEEVWHVKSNLDEAIAEVSECLEKQRFLQRTKRSLHSLSYVQQSVRNLSDLLHLPSLQLICDEKKEPKSMKSSQELPGPDLVERIASELNQLHFRIGLCEDLVSKDYKERLSVIESLLMENLANLFLKSISNTDPNTMKRCLCIFESLGKERQAEEIFQKQVVAKDLHYVISEASLQSNPEGLQGVYRDVLNFIDNRMKGLLELTSHRDRLPVVSGFFFLVNSYWPEVAQRLELHMPSIFAPGNPDNFFQNYSETQKFLYQLEQTCGSQAEVKRLHQHQKYKSFLQLWNLPVYFQIRFQEIGGSMEIALFQWSLNVKSTGGRFKLSPTNALWTGVQQCWSNNIFISNLAHRFWKLTLQLFARYYSWTGDAVKEKWPAEDATSRLSFLVDLFYDIEAVVACLPEVVQLAKEQLHNLSKSSIDHFKASISETADQLVSRLLAVTECIVSEISAASSASLRQVSDIPRLFRRTNRDVPTKPCSYVNAILAPVLDFFKTYNGVVTEVQLQEWLKLICSSITCQFYVCVSDVLTSVQKTEESLRRLKKMRERGLQSASAEGRGLTDNDKIRMQLVIDVNSFTEEIEKLGVKRGDVERLNNLTALVENAMQSQQQVQN